MKTYEISRVQGAPDWQNVPCVAIDNHLWSDVYSISASAQVAWDENNLYVRLQAREQDMLRRYCVDFDPVYLDSCLEFFFCPTEGDDHFFNFEMNPNGALLVGFGKDRHLRTRPEPAQWENLRKTLLTAPFVTADGWGITLQIPVSFVHTFVPEFRLYPGKVLRCNFFKCGDETEMPHFIAWNPIEIESPDFHRPDFFGQMLLK